MGFVLILYINVSIYPILKMWEQLRYIYCIRAVQLGMVSVKQDIFISRPGRAQHAVGIQHIVSVVTIYFFF